MHTSVEQRAIRHASRCGVAPFELVMALPLLFVMFMTLTWLGFSVIGQSEALVEARNKAWKRRFENLSDRPLRFPIKLLGDNNFVYSRDADFAREQVSKKVKIGPVFDRFPSPEATHTILAGSWDHEAMKFDKPPELELMAIAAVTGLAGSGLDIVNNLDDPLGLVKSLSNFRSSGGQALSQINSQSSTVGKGDSSSSSGGGGTPTTPGGGSKTPEEAKRDSEQELEEKKQELRRRYKELGGYWPYSAAQVYPVRGLLKQANDEKVKLQQQHAQKFQQALNAADDETKKQLQKESAQIFRKLEVARITYKRLEAEFKDVVEELEGLGVSRFELNSER